MPSYHDAIQELARAIELQRSKTYSIQGGAERRVKTIVWTERQLLFLYGAIYKLLRVKNETQTKEKAKDDLLDSYNYIALLFDDIAKEGEDPLKLALDEERAKNATFELEIADLKMLVDSLNLPKEVQRE